MLFRLILGNTLLADLSHYRSRRRPPSRRYLMANIKQEDEDEEENLYGQGNEDAF
jgi:hypothetical protein